MPAARIRRWNLREQAPQGSHVARDLREFISEDLHLNTIEDPVWAAQSCVGSQICFVRILRFCKDSAFTEDRQ